MLCITCSGTPDEVGFQHGHAARSLVRRNLSFYARMFKEKSGMSWQAAQQFAAQFIPYLSRAFPALLAEMQGVARGADVSFLDILSLNVRTEIAFGAASDGCTALAWSNITHGHTDAATRQTILAQNWDWDPQQGDVLINLNVKVLDGPWIAMITEAGIIGKIGLSALGVGCTLNAIRARGVVTNKLPCHVALRAALESPSVEDAAAMLEECGLASACHIILADALSGAVGLECSSEDVQFIEPDPAGLMTHTNHYLRPHAPGVTESHEDLPDSAARLRRIDDLLAQAITPSPDAARGAVPILSTDAVAEMLRDETICRTPTADAPFATLFSIVMDLAAATARVTEGRPTAPQSVVELRPRHLKT